MRAGQRFFEREIFSSLTIMGLRVSMLASKFLLALFIVRYLGLQEMGIYGLVSGASAIMPMVMRAGIFSNIARQSVGQTLPELTRNLRHYGTAVLLLYALAALPLCLAAGWHFGAFLLPLLCLAVILFEHASIDIFVITNNLGRAKLGNAVLSLQSSMWIYLYIAFAYFYEPLRTIEAVFAFWIGGGVLAAAIAAFATRKWPWRDAFSKTLSFDWYKTHLTGSWRIYASEIISSTTIYLDRYLIGVFLSIEMVGVYVLFWQVTNAICNLIGAGIFQVITPRLVLAHRERDEAAFHSLFRQSAWKSLAATAALGLAAAITVPFLITFTDNRTAVDYLPLLWAMLGALFFRVGADVYGYALYARHRDDLVFHSALIKITVAATANIVFLQIWDIYGTVPAAIATGGAAILYATIAWKGKKAL